MSDHCQPKKRLAEYESKRAIVDAMVGVLNEAFENDPGAMHALICNCVPVNQAIVNMHHIVVNDYNPQFKTLSMLGVINGILSAAGLPKVASKWSAPNAEGKCELLGFCRYEDPFNKEEASDGVATQ